MTDDPKKSEPQGDGPGHTWHDDTPFPKHWIVSHSQRFSNCRR